MPKLSKISTVRHCMHTVSLPHCHGSVTAFKDLASDSVAG